MERNPITLNDLNFYYPYIRIIVEDNLSELDEDASEELITNNIQLLLSQKMKNPKILKEEINKLRELEEAEIE
jgi:hypothetical protein